jgi:hypothetical protein
MKNRCLACVALLLLALPLAAGAQSALGVTTAAATVDGVFSDKEYTVAGEVNGMKLGLTRTADTLYVGLSAPTTGWVAAGVGAKYMDGAVIYIGYATADGSQLKVQKGAGHRHADLDADAPRKYAVKEAGGTTVLELALDVSAVIAKGQASLELIVASGGSDSFVSFHRARAGVTVALEQ